MLGPIGSRTRSDAPGLSLTLPLQAMRGALLVVVAAASLAGAVQLLIGLRFNHGAHVAPAKSHPSEAFR